MRNYEIEEQELESAAVDPFLEEEEEVSARKRRRRERAAERRSDEIPAAEPCLEAEETEHAAEDDAARPRSRIAEFLLSIVSGNFLSRAEVRKTYPYLLFIAFLMLLYISNIFRMQQLYRRHERLTVQVRELRAKSLSLASQKMNATRQSRVLEELQQRGIPLHESLAPNRVIPK